MIRLMWKEFRERQKWAVGLGLLSVGIVVLGLGQTYVGTPGTFTLWTWLLCPAIVVFLTAGRPTKRPASHFLESRPVPLYMLCFSYYLVDLILIVAVGLLTTAAYIMVHPPQYSLYLTFQRLLIGTGYLLLLMLIPWLAGAILGPLSVSRLAGLAALAPAVCILLLRQYTQGSLHLTGRMEAAWLLCSILVACILLAFARKLTIEQRSTFSLMTAATLFGLHSMISRPAVPAPPKYTWSIVSPDCRYAIVQSLPFDQDSRLHRSRIIRLSDGKSMMAFWPSCAYGQETFWTRNDTAFMITGNSLKTLPVGDTGAPRIRSVRLAGVQPEKALPSPGRDYVALCIRDSHFETSLRVLQVEPPKMLNVRLTGTKDYWWQSNTEIGYTDVYGERHIVRVR
jgi:hypothetical protein